MPDFLRCIFSPRRMGRSHGFGVHSPFAFRFIREVLSQPCAYYAYPLIDALALQCGADARAFRALFRVAVSMLPSSILLTGKIPEEANEVIQLAGLPSNSSIKAIVGLRDGLSNVKEQWSRVESGMLFMAKEMAVYVISPDLPHQRFDIFLP